jgi:putative FmdB family regulatory protein
VPLYEYRCKNCGHTFEKIQSFSAPEEKECPVCRGEVERLISAPAIQFKGSGWYVSDYGGRSGSMKGTAEGNGNSSETKPAEKSSTPTSDSGSASSAPASPSPAKSD